MVNRIYKLTDTNIRSHDEEFQWVPNKWEHTSGAQELCASGQFHCYLDPLMAAYFCNAHFQGKEPYRLWIGAADTPLFHNGIKYSFENMKIVSEIELPVITPAQATAFAILVLRYLSREPSFIAWADAWLSGTQLTPEWVLDWKTTENVFANMHHYDRKTIAQRMALHAEIAYEDAYNRSVVDLSECAKYALSFKEQSPYQFLSHHELGDKLTHWHASGGDPIYAVGSHLFSKDFITKMDFTGRTLRNAISNLRDLPEGYPERDESFGLATELERRFSFMLMEKSDV